ncbi:uncharacterized protein PAC_14567 [Phialocephala subalpina]|uniref:BTB domain-containing protein n=1 Tax=Phialocephala subalpina TaxID=576137 RepID=A0A1L7XHZ6_9HELO|nr:uncharacterized protein PAC_14567 [Phialocephala subalpina]
MTDSTPSASALARTPPSTEPTPDDAFIFAGNVRILATHNRERTEGTASSDALCHARPIDFTEDDSVALLLLLNIAHLKFRRIPDQLPYKLLLQVAILCDQYDCVDLVRPWLKDTLWLRDEQLEFSRMSQRQWLFIAWVFGRDRVFEQAAILLVKLTTRGSVWLTLSPMPPGIVESILSHRLRLIAELLANQQTKFSRASARFREIFVT